MDFTYDAKLWTQEQKNATTAIVVALLWNRGASPITVESMVVTGTDSASVIVSIQKPSADPSARLTQAAVEAQYASMKTTIDAATSTKAAEAAARATELASNPLNNATLAQVDAMIDAAFASASTLAQVKAANILVLKRIARFLRSRGV